MLSHFKTSFYYNILEAGPGESLSLKLDVGAYANAQSLHKQCKKQFIFYFKRDTVVHTHYELNNK